MYLINLIWIFKIYIMKPHVSWLYSKNESVSINILNDLLLENLNIQI